MRRFPAQHYLGSNPPASDYLPCPDHFMKQRVLFPFDADAGLIPPGH
jgi:hypothetical protein